MPPRPKRTATSSELPESGPSRQHAPKKTRFLEPSEDPANFAEEVDAALETPSARGGRGRRTTPARGPAAAAEEEEKEEDMFAMEDKAEKKPEEGAEKKEEFLRLGDIEGQEFGGSGEEEEEEEEEAMDEDEIERRRKAGMGFELSSFHMREEMEEGKFAADGTYVRTFDPHALHDRWMDGLDEKEIKQARKRQRQQERVQRERIRAEERELEEMGGKEAVERKVLGLLKKGETVLEALQRLGAQAKKGRQNAKIASKGKLAGTNGSAMDVDKPKPIQAQVDIDELTHHASTLMSLGDTDVYSKTYEEILRSVRSAGNVEPTWVPPSADVKYEYKWDVPGATTAEGDAFGPFGEEEMQAWFKASYFGVAGEKVKVRKVRGEWGSWDDTVV
ncbi:hypothetical protein EWM64_g2451 [Hericium alpestre]|uniref:GYF domain-containing protein n=1 Tax=Hericium alpestre TaxID=135208 RepID=A0A4Z0A5F7_9AGAM|nr:hypothetical protein EWM64_g2451 [Hericium alpestre]